MQSRGSIDSLILNLKKAQNNAAVQAVVAVADEEQLARIIKESRGVIDEEDLRTWDSEDVLAVYDALVRAMSPSTSWRWCRRAFKLNSVQAAFLTKVRRCVKACCLRAQDARYAA